MFVTVTGGSGSGKSAFAERKTVEFGEGRRLYVATMLCFDNESRMRVKRHRALRAGKGFETVERYTDLAGAHIPQDSIVLLECMSNLVANELFSPEGSKERAEEAVCGGIKKLRECAKHVCVVTNEIFSDGLAYDADTRRYMEVLGRINGYLTEVSDVCYEVVCGIPLLLKGRV